MCWDWKACATCWRRPPGFLCGCIVQAPSCVPSVPGLETAGADFGPDEVAEMLSWERVIGLAEVMDYVA